MLVPEGEEESRDAELGEPVGLSRIARGQANRLTSGVTSPLQGAEETNPLFSPLKRGRDPGKQTMCLPPGCPGEVSLGPTAGNTVGAQEGS